LNKVELYKALKEKIVSEKILPGTWLVVREISEEFSVSRTSVREILRALATDENKSEQAMRNHIKSTCRLLTHRYLLQQTGLASNLNG
jgi:DNA-binding GntR family transcriptional regulator